MLSFFTDEKEGTERARDSSEVMTSWSARELKTGSLAQCISLFPSSLTPSFYASLRYVFCARRLHVVLMFVFM